MTLEDSPLEPSEMYDANYYACNLGTVYERNDHWLAFFGRVADRIVGELKPETVLDVGCAFGFLVEALRDRDVDATGIDISDYAIGQVGGSAVGHCAVGSATEPFEGRFDLVTTVEMIEHLESGDGRAALQNMAAVTDRILLSTTPFDFAEASHVNVQPAEYWAEMMASVGFYRDLSYDASYLTDWAVLYVRRAPTERELIVDYERAESRLRLERNELRREVLRLDALVGELRIEQAERSAAEIAELKQQVLIARDAVEIAEAELGSNKAMLRVVKNRLEVASSQDSKQIDDQRIALEERLYEIENSTTWRFMWTVLAPYRWLRGRR